MGDATFDLKSITDCLKHVRSDGKIMVKPLCEAARDVVPLYDKIFGEGLVSKTLKGDLNGSSNQTETAFNALSGCTDHLSLIKMELDAKSLDVVRKNKKSGVVSSLWLKRAFEFIATYVDLVIRTDKPSKECATTTYTKVLKPFHGMVVSNIVGLAMGMVPTREDFVKKIGFASLEEAKEPAGALADALKAIVDDMNANFDSTGTQFTDKA